MGSRKAGGRRRRAYFRGETRKRREAGWQEQGLHEGNQEKREEGGWQRAKPGPMVMTKDVKL